MSLIDPRQFQQALVDWHTQLCEAHHAGDTAGDADNSRVHIAIDGKTSRGSYTDKEKSNALHFVSAWATKHGVALGQTEVDSKSNEITAIDELIDFIDVRDSVITIDAIAVATPVPYFTTKEAAIRNRTR